MTTSIIIPIGTKIRIITKYVVDTNSFPLFQLLRAIDSANLFFNPCEKPISKIPIHPTIDDNVSQMPYNSEETYPRVNGTRTKEISKLRPLYINDPNMFRFTATVLFPPFEKKDLLQSNIDTP